MKDAVPVGTQHVALGSYLTGHRRWAVVGLLDLEEATGCWPALCLPRPPLQLSSTARRGTGANHASASSKGFLGAANHLPSAAGKGPRGVCEASLCAEAGSSLSSGSGHASLPAWRSLADLPWVPGLPWEDDRAVLGCWEQGGTGFATGQLETHLGCEAGVNTWMLPGCLSSRLLGPQWLGHS